VRSPGDADGPGCGEYARIGVPRARVCVPSREIFDPRRTQVGRRIAPVRGPCLEPDRRSGFARSLLAVEGRGESGPGSLGRGRSLARPPWALGLRGSLRSPRAAPRLCRDPGQRSNASSGPAHWAVPHASGPPSKCAKSRSCSPAAPQTKQQPRERLPSSKNWWRRRESNPRPHGVQTARLRA